MLFSNSDYPVGNETREWLDARISWIVDHYGIRQMRLRSTATIQQELFDGYSPKDDASLRLVLDRLCRDLEIRSEVVEYTILRRNSSPAMMEQLWEPTWWFKW
ncbi:MAG: hypothetical protein JNK90_22955 [Planctomycetaceae bacterium]|nr:hypothetical protein [Planctomycetaceae bacterium]